MILGDLRRGLKSVRESSSFAPLGGWIISHLYPRLTPWAVFFRYFAARNCWPCSTLNLQSEISRTHLKRRPFKTKIRKEFFSSLPGAAGVCIDPSRPKRSLRMTTLTSAD